MTALNLRFGCGVGLAAALSLWPGRSALGQATIAYCQPTTPVVLWDTAFGQHYVLDLDGDGNPELTFAYDFHFIGVRSEWVTRIFTSMSPPPNLGGSVAPLSLGFSIGLTSEVGSLQWVGRIPPYEFDFSPLIQCFDIGCAGDFRGQHAYMGVEFQRAGATHYGWVLLQVSADYAIGSIESWAWETRPGVSIKAGARPVIVAVAVPVVVRAGFLRLSWLSEIGKAYQVQSKPSLDAFAWTNLNFAVPATTTNTLLDLPMTGATQFFRVVEAD